MKFVNIYNKIIKYWPKEIDISDGSYIKETDGYLFPSLSKIWDTIERKVGTSNEWKSLMVWTMFQVFHELAKKKYKQNKENKILLPRSVTMELIQNQYIKNLKEKGHEDMLKEFLKIN